MDTDPWKYRRRFMSAICAFSAGSIWGAVILGVEPAIANNIITMGFGLLATSLTSYVFGAAWEEKAGVQPVFKIYMLAGAILLGVFGSGYWYINHLSDKNEALNRMISALDVQVEAQNLTIRQAESAIKEWSANHEALETRFRDLQNNQYEAAESLRNLHALFTKHDFAKLVKAKPGLLQKRINRGTERTRLLLECATGADQSCVGRNKAAPGSNSAAETSPGRS